MTKNKEFINKAKMIHQDKYNYDQVNYVNSSTKVKLYCNTCRVNFMTIPNSHISNKSGCPDCGTRRMKEKQSMGLDKFIERSVEIHKDIYSYDKAVYINSKTPLIIYCKSCQEYFKQTPGDHLYNKSGCPRRRTPRRAPAAATCFAKMWSHKNR